MRRVFIALAVVFVGGKAWAQTPRPDQRPSNDAPHLAMVGIVSAFGKGVPSNAPNSYAREVKLFRKAAMRGVAPAEQILGLAYYEGHGVPRDYAMAAEWFRRAAAQGLAPAEFSLGVAYVRGRGVPRDYALGLKWFRKAAEQGLSPGELDVGLAYAHGQAVPRNYAKAYEWLALAEATARAGGPSHLRASQAIKSLEIHMSPTQIADAQSSALAWFKSHLARK